MKVPFALLTVSVAILCLCLLGAQAAQAQSCAEEAGCSDSGSCDSGCGSCGSDSCRCIKWLPLIKPTPSCFCDYISPMTNPTMFEDPRTLTEVRAIFFDQRLPAAFGGANARMAMVQLRAALSDRLSVVLTKDGFLSTPFGDGWADIMIGVKYNLITNYSTRRMITVGVSYEGPWGTPAVYQGSPRLIDGTVLTGQYHAYITGGTPIGYNSHYIGAFGIRAPMDNLVQTSMFYWSNHFDKQVGSTALYGVAEVNWYHWYDSGNVGGLAGVNGGDIINLGSTGVTGTDIVTGALGLKFKPSANLEIGVVYEAPLTTRRGLMEDRITGDIILRY